jgi:hypothetical protein
MRWRGAAVVAGLALAAGTASAQDTPKVVSTSPSQGAKAPPSLSELKVSYDHRMAASWSFATGGEKAFPELWGNPSLSDDHITITLPIRLEPNRTYVVWMNTDRYKNFKSEDGAAAEPYRLTFSTTD